MSWWQRVKTVSVSPFPAAQGPRHLMSQNVLFRLGYLEGVLPFVSQGDTVMKFLYSIENKNSANY